MQHECGFYPREGRYAVVGVVVVVEFGRGQIYGQKPAKSTTPARNRWGFQGTAIDRIVFVIIIIIIYYHYYYYHYY